MKIPWFEKKNVSVTEAIDIVNNATILIVAKNGRLPLPLVKLALFRKRLFSPSFSSAYSFLKRGIGVKGLHNLICAILVKTTMYSQCGTAGGKKKVIPITGNLPLLKLLNTKAP